MLVERAAGSARGPRSSFDDMYRDLAVADAADPFRRPRRAAVRLRRSSHLGGAGRCRRRRPPRGVDGVPARGRAARHRRRHRRAPARSWRAWPPRSGRVDGPSTRRGDGSRGPAPGAWPVMGLGRSALRGARAPSHGETPRSWCHDDALVRPISSSMSDDIGHVRARRPRRAPPRTWLLHRRHGPALGRRRAASLSPIDRRSSSPAPRSGSSPTPRGRPVGTGIAGQPGADGTAGGGSRTAGGAASGRSARPPAARRRSGCGTAAGRTSTTAPSNVRHTCGRWRSPRSARPRCSRSTPVTSARTRPAGRRGLDDRPSGAGAGLAVARAALVLRQRGVPGGADRRGASARAPGRRSSDGLTLLRWLLGRETIDDHLSPTPVGGAGPDDPGPGFDQQPIEVAAIADACAARRGRDRRRRVAQRDRAGDRLVRRATTTPARRCGIP